MKNQDLISKRILTVAFALSMILCSAALFVLSLNFSGKAKAATTVVSPIVASKISSANPAGEGGFIASAGVANNYAYYIYLAPNGNCNYWKASLSLFKDVQ